MNDIGKWVEELMAAGCMPKVAAKVAIEIFTHGFNAGIQSAPKDAAAERRREWDRERKRAERQKRNSAESGGNRVELAPTQWLWTEGQGLLRQLGATETQARGNIGRWLKAGHDPASIKVLVVDVHQKGIGDPIPWVTKALGNAKGRTNGRQQHVSDLAFDLADEIRDAERAAGVGRSDAPIRRS